jgi:hypothetical protein
MVGVRHLHQGINQCIRESIAGEFGAIVPPVDHRVFVWHVQPRIRSCSIVPPNIAEMAERGIAVIDPTIETLKWAIPVYKGKT